MSSAPKWWLRISILAALLIFSLVFTLPVSHAQTGLVLSPASGLPGATIIVSGSSFTSGQTIQVTYDGTVETTNPGTCTVASNTTFSCSIHAPTTGAGTNPGNHTIIASDSLNESASAIFSVDAVQPITVTMSSGPTELVTIDGCNPYPSSFNSDGSAHEINMTANCKFSLYFSNSGDTRDGFDVSGSFSATSSTYTTSNNSLVITAYTQVNNTFTANFAGSPPSSGDTVNVVGTYLGSSSAVLGSITSDGSSSSDSATIWSDYGSTVTMASTTANSNNAERWADSSGYTTPSITAGNQTFSITYYHQYYVSLSYKIANTPAGTGYSNPAVAFSQFGLTASDTALQNSPSSDWIDAGIATVSYPSLLQGSGATEAWLTNSLGLVTFVDVTSSSTITVSYYHQYYFTLQFKTSDGSNSSGVDVQATRFGVTGPILASTSGTPIGLDAGSTYTYSSASQDSNSSERWVAQSAATGTVSSSLAVDPEYFHQFSIQASYVITDALGSCSAPTLTYTSFSSSVSLVMSTSASGIWVDNGSSWSSTNPLSGSGTTERCISSGASGTVFSSGNISPNYVHEFLVKTSSSPSSGGSVTPSSGWENAGSSITLKATPSTDYTFSSWNGTGTGSYNGTANPISITVTASLNETANFAYNPPPPPTYTVTFAERGLPVGTTWSIAINGVPYSVSGSSITVGSLSGISTFDFQTSLSTVTADKGGVVYTCTAACSGAFNGGGSVVAQYSIFNVTMVVNFQVPSGESPIQISATGCQATPSSFSGNGAVSIRADSYCSFTLSTIPSSLPSGFRAVFNQTHGVTYAIDTTNCALSNACSGIDGSYFLQSELTVSYTTSGGNLTNTPNLLYTSFGGAGKTLSLSTTPQTVWADVGSNWSVNPATVIGSIGERWIVANSSSGLVNKPANLTFLYQHEFRLNVSYSVSDGSPPSTPLFRYTNLTASGENTNLPLKTSSLILWADAGSTWRVNASIAGASGERWVLVSLSTGYVSGPETLDFTYLHQFQLTISVLNPGSGTTTPPAGVYWENASSTVQIVGVVNSRYAFSDWGFSGVEVSNVNSVTTSVNMTAAGTLTLVATPISTTYVLSLSSSAQSFAPGSSVTISAELTEITTAGGITTTKPVSGAAVTFDIASGPDAGQTATATTDANGLATSTYSNSGGAGTDTVTAAASGISGLASIAVTFTGQYTMTLSPTSQGAVATVDTATLTATVVDPSGNPASGVSVTFSVTSGPDSGETETGSTDSTGTATFTLSASKAGTDTVDARFQTPATASAPALTVTSNQVEIKWAAPVVISGSGSGTFGGGGGGSLPGGSVTFSLTLTSPSSALSIPVLAITGSTAEPNTTTYFAVLSVPESGILPSPLTMNLLYFYVNLVPAAPLPTGTTAKLCLSYSMFNSGTDIQYWNGSVWVNQSGLHASGDTVCGTVLASSLNQASFAAGNLAGAPTSESTTSTAAPGNTPSFSTPIIEALVAALLVAVLVTVGLVRRHEKNSA